MQDPPRGSYYPAGGINAMQQQRQYLYSANNPWQREEREKVIEIYSDENKLIAIVKKIVIIIHMHKV